MSKKYYAGIGSRQTPPDILDLMGKVAIKLRDDGWILRSGGADGADTAFAQQLERTDVEVFIPWRGFNGIDSDLIGATNRALQIAEANHPAWNRCSQGARKLHARNVHQVYGWDIDPTTYSRFVICWTPGAERVGGTATAIKLAENVGIEVFNLANADVRDRFEKFVGA